MMSRAARHAVKDCLSLIDSPAYGGAGTKKAAFEKGGNDYDDAPMLSNWSRQTTPDISDYEAYNAISGEVVLRLWPGSKYMMVNTIRDAADGSRSLRRMRDVEEGCFVAVKRQTAQANGSNRNNSEFDLDPELVEKDGGETSEELMREVSMLQHLAKQQYPFMCDLHGVFIDPSFIYIVSSFADEGNLLSWSTNELQMGCERETSMRPLVVQMCSALRDLHDLGICHRDISLESFVLKSKTAEERRSKGGLLRIQLVDYKASVFGQMCPYPAKVGGDPYRAPELHDAMALRYDGFAADIFALGVTTFCMATTLIPWRLTQSGDKLFELFKSYGYSRYLAERRTRARGFSRLDDLLSSGLAELTEGLLQIDPLVRFSLGEANWCAQEYEELDAPEQVAASRQTVWVLDWLAC
jgi:serine/threonine protein kinase